MNAILLQGLSVSAPIVLGVVGMLINNSVNSYRSDKHFYKTRFLDRDGEPESDDPGYIKDDSGNLIPIIVKKYSFGRKKKNRFVEFVEISPCGKYGYPRKESLSSFRSKEILRPKKKLTSGDKYLLNSSMLINRPVENLLCKEEAEQGDELSVAVKDLARSVDGLGTRVTNLGKKIVRTDYDTN